MKFFFKDFFSKCSQFRRKLQVWSHLLKKFLMKNFAFLFSVKIRKDNLPLNQCLNFFIFFFCFICYFLSNMLVERGSPKIFTTCQRKKQCGESSMFHFYNCTIINSLFFFLSYFFRIPLTGKYFCERGLVFIKRMSKKGHIPWALVPGLASAPV